MNIKLDSEYSIQSDSRNFILVKTGKDREFHTSYHDDIEGVVRSYVNMNLRASKAQSIEELLNAIKVLSALLNKTLQPLKLEVHPLSEIPLPTSKSKSKKKE